MSPAIEAKEVATGTALDPAIAQELAGILGAFLTGEENVQLEIRAGRKGRTTDLPRAVLKQLHALMNQLGQDHSVMLRPAPALLTIVEAADYLNVSLNHAIQLLDEGTIPSIGEGDQRLVPFPDLQAYYLDWKQKRLAALDELTALSQEFGMGY